MDKNMNDSDLINQISAQLLGGGQGVAPSAPAPVPQDVPQEAPMPQEPPKADPNPTPTEKATKKADPVEGNEQEPFAIYDIKMGDGNVQQFSSQQIANTMNRYAQLNSRVLENKDVLDFATRITEQAKKNGYTPKAGEVASFLQEAVKAYTKNPTMGNVEQKQQLPADSQPSKPAQPPADDELANWERDNGLKLPPGFREQNHFMQQIAQQMQQMQQMLMQMQQGGAQSATTAQQQGQQALQQAQQIQGNTQQMQVKMNLKQAANAQGVPDDRAKDFMLFAMQRGYTPADFLDPQVAETLMADFKANMDAPEIQRLREVMQRRQAYTGNPTGTPSQTGAGVPPQMSPDQQYMEDFIQKVMANKM